MCFLYHFRICFSYTKCQRKCATLNTTPILYLSNPDRLRSVSLHEIYWPKEFGITFDHTVWLRNRLSSSKNPVGRPFQECDNPDFPTPSVRVRATKGIITYLRRSRIARPCHVLKICLVKSMPHYGEFDCNLFHHYHTLPLT